MRPRISEFSYGFALTRELIDQKWRGIALTKAPYMPSLLAEGRSGGGFDVKLHGVNVLIFLQFKVSHLMTRSTAMGVATGHVSVPYYRFDIHAPRSSDQHRLLLQLEQQPSPIPKIVQYAAPAFYFEGEFDHAFSKGTVSTQSIFVNPSQIVLPDEDAHCVGFTSPTSVPVTLSEPRPIEGAVDYTTFERSVTAAVDGPTIPLAGHAMTSARDGLFELIRHVGLESQPEILFSDKREIRRHVVRHVVRARETQQLDEAVRRDMRPLDAIGHIAWTRLGCQTIALGPEA